MARAIVVPLYDHVTDDEIEGILLDLQHTFQFSIEPYAAELPTGDELALGAHELRARHAQEVARHARMRARSAGSHALEKIEEARDGAHRLADAADALERFASVRLGHGRRLHSVHVELHPREQDTDRRSI